MVDARVLQRKLNRLLQYLDELEAIRPARYEDYVRDIRTRRAVERLIQLLVEVANDINVHAVVNAGQPPPKDYYDGFIQAGEIGLIPRDLARRLAPSAGERNILVHEYEEIDDRIVFESIDQALTLFRAYARAVLAHVRGQG